MNYYLKTACGVLALWAAGVAWAADALTPEQKEVMQFVEKMYSYDPDTFEFGYFLKKTGAPFLRNKVPSNYSAIKFSPEKKCLFLSSFFVDEAFQKKKGKSERDDCDAPDRYPFLSDDNRSSVTRFEDIPAPYIKPPVVSGNRAKVEVFPAGNKKISNPPNFDLGRNLYFLTKTDNGWRVSNVLIHTKWPDLDDGTHHCYFSFSKAPNDEEKKEIPKHCR
jgi:hypothetical protein